MSGSKYAVGRQPCASFKARDEGYGIGNEHSCACGRAGPWCCRLTVSFCDNCASDHHADGYENCGCENESNRPTPTPEGDTTEKED